MNAGAIRRTLARTVVALAAVTGACGGGGDGPPADADPAHDPGGQGALDGGGTNPAVAGSAGLEEALLTVTDLPDGLIDLELDPSAVETCGMRREMPDSVAGDQLPSSAVAFAPAGEPIVPDVFEKLVVAPDGSGAEVFQRVRGLLDICGNGGEVDGLAFLSATALAAPPLGDETVAKRVTIEHLASNTVVGLDVLYARAGDTIVGVGVVEPEGQTDRLVELSTLAFNRATTR